MPNDIPTISIADDDALVRALIAQTLEASGFRVEQHADGRAALEAIDDRVAVALFDLQMPGPSGLECLVACRHRFPDLPVMMVSGAGEARDAVAAMKQGAFDYITKPIDRDELVARVREASRLWRLARENAELRDSLSDARHGPELIAVSPSGRDLVRRAQRAAGVDSVVLITGPSGTGKSLLARWIHANGARARRPLVSVSCAALPRDLVESELFGHERGAFTGAVSARAGRFELAHGGTLFLDEIGELPLDLQPKLLTALQDRRVTRVGGTVERDVDVRIIAATNRDLETLVAQREFREDLFFRLNVVRLDVPPLASRADDIIPIASAQLDTLSRRMGLPRRTFSPGACDALRRHTWPGNVRELENVLERAVVFSDGEVIGPDDLHLTTTLSTRTPAGADLSGMTLAAIERRAILDTLDRVHGNRAAAARMLGVSERTIYNKLGEYRARGPVGGTG